MGEFEFIRELRARTPAAPGVLVGPGDDCAVLARPGNSVLVTTDTLMEGVDFRLAECGPKAAGRKAMAVNLSDIAAMAGRPTAALVSLVLPHHQGELIARGVDEGLREVAGEFGVPIVGGDVNSWHGELVVTVTVLGEATERGSVLRSGAKPGDWLFVTGPLGGSLLGRHLSPRPRVAEALALHAAIDLHAMIDISDGLSADLMHILEESGCGAVLHASAIPVHIDAIEYARQTGKTPLEHALGDGEDFELVFAVAPEDGERLLTSPPVAGLYKIGECVESGLWLEDGGVRNPLPARGWTHTMGED